MKQGRRKARKEARMEERKKESKGGSKEARKGGRKEGREEARKERRTRGDHATSRNGKFVVNMMELTLAVARTIDELELRIFLVPLLLYISFCFSSSF